MEQKCVRPDEVISKGLTDVLPLERLVFSSVRVRCETRKEARSLWFC